MTRSPPPRREHDLVGELDIPADAYYGIHSARAVANFPISGETIGSYAELVEGLALVKQAAALANRDLGVLGPAEADAICRACEDIRAGHLHDQFVVDPIQGGAGTSTNMNANEVIANRALEKLGRSRGEYDRLHPIDHVNCSQSTNDVYPTAVRVALSLVTGRLLSALGLLGGEFDHKAVEFADVVKVGRTQLQDAVPMTLGQEFGAYGAMVAQNVRLLEERREALCEVNLGGTAVGTGLQAPPGYAESACRHLAELTGMPIVLAADLVEATQDVGPLVQLSSAVKVTALRLSKICNDLRLLSSGPRAGLEEITLPAVQAGSSMMPGKVNPVIPEVVNQIAFEVIGHDLTVTMAAEGGQLELNAFEPVIMRALYQAITHLEAGARVLAERCVSGITARRRHLSEMADHTVGVVTALNSRLGYSQTTELAREALATGRDVEELVEEHHLLQPEELDSLLEPRRVAGLEAPERPAPSSD
ncbi:MAG TPA: aspartate ammonia-lyase [Acidimicrobiales bacterium]|nr:aspartate ammonia-lyase [Acidimicrobiales bacterium]